MNKQYFHLKFFLFLFSFSEYIKINILVRFLSVKHRSISSDYWTPLEISVPSSRTNRKLFFFATITHLFTYLYHFNIYISVCTNNRLLHRKI